MTNLVALILLLFGINREFAQTNNIWINGGKILPRLNDAMCVAYWNKAFYLFGMLPLVLS